MNFNVDELILIMRAIGDRMNTLSELTFKTILRDVNDENLKIIRDEEKHASELFDRIYTYLKNNT